MELLGTLEFPVNPDSVVTQEFQDSAVIQESADSPVTLEFQGSQDIAASAVAPGSQVFRLTT